MEVTKAETRGNQRRTRRALSDAEIERLIRSAGGRSLPYFFAAYTGLRRGEMKALVWSDLDLEAENPFILARASTTKNKKPEQVLLVPELAVALRKFRDFWGATAGKVFRHGVPTAKTLRKDLVACDIAPTSELGARVDSQRESLVLSNLGTPWPEAETGGEGGIRTHGTLAGTPDFESGTIDHSATSPVHHPSRGLRKAGTRDPRPEGSKRKPKIGHVVTWPDKRFLSRNAPLPSSHRA